MVVQSVIRICSSSVPAYRHIITNHSVLKNAVAVAFAPLSPPFPLSAAITVSPSPPIFCGSSASSLMLFLRIKI